ncbi:Sterol O-acyltransferase 2 (Sterol-ester synthase 2) [Savitreella phatthalungensis]
MSAVTDECRLEGNDGSAQVVRRPLVSRKPTKDARDFTPEKEARLNDKMAASFSATRRKMSRDVKFKPANTAFDRHNQEHNSSFHGFFTLFWIGLGTLVVKTLFQHWRATGHFFGGRLAVMYALNIWDLAATDAIMVVASVFCYFLQVAVLRGVSWETTGWYIQQAWQTLYLATIIYRSWVYEWQWIQSVVIILHCCVMLMKQHSYAQYLGYLSELYKRRQTLAKHLEVVHKLDALKYNNMSEKNSHETELLTEIKEIDDELTLDGVTYPQNLTLSNFVDYLLVPSLVYDISYPRTERIRWSFVLEKTVAALGCFGLMSMMVEHYMLPIIPLNLDLMTSRQKLEEMPWMMLDMAFPLISLYLLFFYLTFECILQWFAELTRFADRNFYNDWWNSISFDEFARDWNVPVHRFLLRHVYHSSISALQLRKEQATLVTFVLSSLVHELVMACMTKKIRLYFVFIQMLQIPIIMISRSKFFRHRTTLGNSFFWFSLMTGPPLICLVYILF